MSRSALVKNETGEILCRAGFPVVTARFVIARFVIALSVVALCFLMPGLTICGGEKIANVNTDVKTDDKAIGQESMGQASIGKQVLEFALEDIYGTQHTLAEVSDEKMVVFAFLGTECPLAKLYGPRLQKLSENYAGRGVAFFAVSSNCQDSVLELRAYASRHDIKFPLLKDVGNKFADQIGATRTPEVFVLDENRTIRYRGRIDDQYGVGYAKDLPVREDLREAIDELLAGEKVSIPVTESIGCFIGRLPQPKQNAEVTYSNQVSRIFQKHCVECHRRGEIAPFELTDYDEIVGWADTIAEVIQDKRMPPWHANPDHGDFKNARLMSDEEKELVYQWVKDGAPQGDPADLPEPRTFLTGWHLPREPDQVIAMSKEPYQVAAQGIVEYQYFVVDPGLSEDKWVSAAEVIPGNPGVVHHSIVFIRSPNAAFDGVGWIGAYVPGQSPVDYPPGYARRIPAGSKLVFQMHYTPNGSVQQDMTKIGLCFVDRQQVTKQLLTIPALERDFEIPPFAADFQVEKQVTRIPDGGQLMSLAPHMHLRGKSFRVLLQEQDAKESRVLLDVPQYDFNWQHTYQLKTPLELKNSQTMTCIAVFDNSENNLVNPDPSAAVRWGDQTFEEMAVAFFDVALPVDWKFADIDGKEREDQRQLDARDQAQAFVARFDGNQDGRVQPNEVPASVRVFGFRRFDTDNDDEITVDEAAQALLDDLR